MFFTETYSLLAPTIKISRAGEMHTARTTWVMEQTDREEKVSPTPAEEMDLNSAYLVLGEAEWRR